LSNRTFNRYKSSMFLYDLMGHRQAKTATLVLASEKWIEDMLQIFFRNSDTIISHLNLNELTGGLDTVSLDGSTQKRHRPGACHRLNGVQNEVHKYLLHLLSVNPHL